MLEDRVSCVITKMAPHLFTGSRMNELRSFVSLAIFDKWRGRKQPNQPSSKSPIQLWF